MPMPLRNAMQEFLSGWESDLAPAWQDFLGPVSLDLNGIPERLELEIWEPIFPARRGKHFPGMPPRTHALRAFDGLTPGDVRCVILGQDPYPEPGFATGRAFEAGNLAVWREMDKMFSKSIRAYMQMIVAARTWNPSYGGSFANWPKTLAAIEARDVEMEAPGEIADRWVKGGTLLLNASLTLTRFKVDIDEHQALGHLVLWRPLIIRTLQSLAARGQPLVVICFGDAAKETLSQASISAPRVRTILRDHPAKADAVLAEENPFLLCNSYLEEMGAGPISW